MYEILNKHCIFNYYPLKYSYYQKIKGVDKQEKDSKQTFLLKTIVLLKATLKIQTFNKVKAL